MNDPSDPSKPGGAAFDIPDLDLAAPAPRPAPAPAATPRKDLPAPITDADPMEYMTAGFAESDFERGGAASSTEQNANSVYSGASLDLDDEEGLGGAIELQSYRPPAPAASSLSPSSTQGPSAAAAPHHAAPAKLVDVDLTVVQQLAGYGPAPKAFYLAPLYSWKVLTRRRELRAAIAQLNVDNESAELARDNALADVTRSVRAVVENDARFEASFAAVRSLEGMAGARGEALSQLSAQAKSASEQIGQQIAALQAQVDQQKQAEQAAARELQVRQEAAGRVVAKQKRLLIEARAATQVGQQAAGQPGAPIPPEHAQKIQELQMQAAALQPEAQQLQQELTNAQNALAAVRNQLAQLGQQMRQLGAQQQGLERQFQGQISAQQADYSAVQKELTAALAQLGRTLLAEDGVQLERSLRDAVIHAEQRLENLTRDREHHLRALDVYDSETYKRGFVVVGGVFAAIVLLIVVLALVR